MTVKTRRVLRYEVPIDDQPHPVASGPVVMAHRWRQSTTTPATRVELWVEATTLSNDWFKVDKQRLVQVFGTGHDIPEHAIWLASTTDGSLVWHIYDVSYERKDNQ